MRIERNAVHSGFDGKTCWVHARVGVIPQGPAVMTTQKLTLTSSDHFYGIASMESVDGGKTFSEPAEQSGLRWRSEPDGVTVAMSDATPKWHAASGTLLLTGHDVRYKGEHLCPNIRRRCTAYSTYDQQTKTWNQWKTLQMPDEARFFNCGAGSTQRVDLEDGTILLPLYMRVSETMLEAAVVRCAFDGETMKFIEIGSTLRTKEPRGLGEPSLVEFQGRYFLTLRNDVMGYVAVSKDGLNFTPQIPWCFDDGSELGNYNTQQHWLRFGDNELYLVYTRRGADNDNTFRHRAPLFIARFDPDRLCVIRETEQEVVPNRGARLGNFGVCEVSDSESWVVAAEWMQTTPPDPHDYTVCQKYGSDNTIWLAKVLAS